MNEQGPGALARCCVRLATPADARELAQMSRIYVEHGLGWRYTEARMRAAIAHRATNVAVAHEDSQIVGFGMMEYGEARAHLTLLAVHRYRQRRGIGTAIVRWLEDAARTAGLDVVRVEARADNAAAHAFYLKLGYVEKELLVGHYAKQEDAVRFEKRLGS